MNPDMSIAIVGGSLVGPATALLLEKAGFHNVTLFEEMPHAESRSGGVMGVRFPVIDVLEEIGIDRREVTALHDTNVYGYDITMSGVPVARGASEFPGVVTSWDELHSRLASNVDINHKHKITSIGAVDGAMHLGVNDKDFGEFDLVIFADGRKSTGRELLDSTRSLEYQGYVVWRGLTDPPRPVPSGFNRYYNIDGGKLFSVTEPVIQSGRSYWELSHNLDRDVWRKLAGGEPEDRAYLLPHKVNDLAKDVIGKAMRHYPEPFKEIVANSEISGIPVNDTRFPNRAAFPIGKKGWAVLLGDALIPVRLQVGAGLNQGLLEAKRLIELLVSRDDPYLYRDWENDTLDVMAKWVELGRARVGRTNLGRYSPVRPGQTAAPRAGMSQWDEPVWVPA